MTIEELLEKQKLGRDMTAGELVDQALFHAEALNGRIRELEDLGFTVDVVRENGHWDRVRLTIYFEDRK